MYFNLERLRYYKDLKDLDVNVWCMANNRYGYSYADFFEVYKNDYLVMVTYLQKLQNDPRVELLLQKNMQKNVGFWGTLSFWANIIFYCDDLKMLLGRFDDKIIQEINEDNSGFCMVEEEILHKLCDFKVVCDLFFQILAVLESKCKEVDASVLYHELYAELRQQYDPKFKVADYFRQTLFNDTVVTIAFLRANKENPLRRSIVSLLSEISKYCDDRERAPESKLEDDKLAVKEFRLERARSKLPEASFVVRQAQNDDKTQDQVPPKPSVIK